MDLRLPIRRQSSAATSDKNAVDKINQIFSFTFIYRTFRAEWADS